MISNDRRNQRGTPVTSEETAGLETYVPGTEVLADDEVRVTVLGSGDPWVRRTQASGSLLIEVGNAERDVFFFDVGAGALANFSGLDVPVTETTKVFLTHLHADHMGDVPTLLGSLSKTGRIDPVEIWGGGSDQPELGLACFVDHINAAMAWDKHSVRGLNTATGAEAIAHELPYDETAVAYERDGVVVTSFPVIHALNGALGYKLEYAGRSVVFSGDTRPCRFLVEAARGVDLLVHECFQSPAVMAHLLGVEVAYAENLLKAAHTVPTQAGKVFALAQPKVAALYHLDLRPGVDTVLKEVGSEYDGQVVVCHDLTVFNLTESGVRVRQARPDPASTLLKGESHTKPYIAPPAEPPSWWADAALDV